MSHSNTSILAILSGVGLALSMASSAYAASPTEQYRADVQRCKTTPGIDQKACLSEAGAALAAARRDALTDPSAQMEADHRTERCDRLPTQQREQCMMLMQSNQTRTEGSVQSGGILRETTITIPADGS